MRHLVSLLVAMVLFVGCGGGSDGELRRFEKCVQIAQEGSSSERERAEPRCGDVWRDLGY